MHILTECKMTDRSVHTTQKTRHDKRKENTLKERLLQEIVVFGR
jgi:hypothetical protein